VLAGREASQRGARDFGAPGTAHGRCEPDPGASATPGRRVLRLTPPQPRDLMPLPRSSWEGGLGRHAQGGCVASPPARLHSSAGTRQRPSSAPLHQPSPSTRPLSCLYAYAALYAYRFGPNLVRQEPIWSPKMLHASSLGVGSTQGGGQPLLEAAGIEPAAWYDQSGLDGVSWEPGGSVCPGEVWLGGGWWGAGGGVPAETAGGDGVVCGGEGQPRHAAGGGEPGGARPAPVRGAGRAPGTWSAECWHTASRGCAARVDTVADLQG
jgi:hypothetical protein